MFFCYFSMRCLPSGTWINNHVCLLGCVIRVPADSLSLYIYSVFCLTITGESMFFSEAAVICCGCNLLLFFCCFIPFLTKASSKRFFMENCPTNLKGVLCYAKSLQSRPTLCDPIDGSPPGSPVPGILQARTLEWAAISFSNAWKWKAKVKSLSGVWLLATPWIAA